MIESYVVSDAVRRVLLGADPDHGVRLTKRAVTALASVRSEYARRVSDEATVIVQESTGPRCWTWAGARANAVLVAALTQVAPELLDDLAYTNRNVRLRGDATASALTRALWDARQRFGPDLSGVVPEVTEDAVRGLKFL